MVSAIIIVIGIEFWVPFEFRCFSLEAHKWTLPLMLSNKRTKGCVLDFCSLGVIINELGKPPALIGCQFKTMNKIRVNHKITNNMFWPRNPNMIKMSTSAFYVQIVHPSWSWIDSPPPTRIILVTYSFMAPCHSSIQSFPLTLWHIKLPHTKSSSPFAAAAVQRSKCHHVIAMSNRKTTTRLLKQMITTNITLFISSICASLHLSTTTPPGRPPLQPNQHHL